MMKNHYQSVKINHNANWLYIPDHLYKISTSNGSAISYKIFETNSSFHVK